MTDFELHTLEQHRRAYADLLSALTDDEYYAALATIPDAVGAAADEALEDWDAALSEAFPGGNVACNTPDARGEAGTELRAAYIRAVQANAAYECAIATAARGMFSRQVH